MTRIYQWPAAIVAAALVTGGAYAANGRQAGEPVSISAVVLDRAGLPVRNLKPSDLVVREDGKPVGIAQFRATNAAETAGTGRSIVLLLGGQGGDPELTKRYQDISQAFFNRATAADSISVVRMKDDHDEVAGSRREMLMRLAEFRAPYGEPLNPKTSEAILDRVARIARDFPSDNRRKAIVCIGPAWVFDVTEPPQRQYEIEWPYWVKALTNTARANASVYAIDPKSNDGRIRINPDGLIMQTGGAIVENSNDFEGAVERVWRETGNYYTFEYASAGGKRELHSIEVKVTNPELSVRARRSR